MSYRYPFSGTPWRNWLGQDNGLIPNNSVTELALEGFAPLASKGGNDGHPSDGYDSLEQELAGKNTEALYFALTANKLTADVPDDGGHPHQAELGEIEWLPFWQSATPTGLAAGTHIGNAGGAYADSQNYKELGWAILAIGEWSNAFTGQTFYYLRARGKAPAYGTADATDLDLKFTFFKPIGAGNKEITTQVLTPFVLKLPTGTSDQWVVSSPYDFGSELSSLVTNNGWAFLYAKIEIRCSASPGAATLFEINVGKIGGL